ncbi:flagellar hook-associated protein FlgL [Halanaerobiaceae bacterium Z-7014]|uniref:Flagellar hook-associated protein FlgL n=1 Tax=Halonatronomonas betaini TaxID=2778430 RepID=A0A931ATF5_9FIRM|nr:flagellar hook-associated protein FlgL [Halonatronomonas betaini]MBF8437854.1 flagellar hook-associated protein FlgL [Halonatronomonas betaini]
MRITNNVMIGNMMQNLQHNMKNLDKLNQQLSSGKQFRFPSEAPIQASRSMDFNSQLNNVDQFKKNVDQANSWMETTESALTDGNEVLQRARELTIYGANDTMTETERENLAREVEELRSELLAITETRHGDRYVFSGQATDEKPFDENAEYQGDDRKIRREINPGVEMAVNVTGREGFEDAIEAMDHLLSDLRGGSARVYGELGPGKLAENSDEIDADTDVSLNITIDGENFEVTENSDGEQLTGDTTRAEFVQAINDAANEALGTTGETYARVRNGNLEIRSLTDGEDSEISIETDEAEPIMQLLNFEETDAAGGEGSLMLSTSDISRFDNAIDKNVTTRAEIGAKMNRLDLTQSRLEDQEINLRSLKSENEDVDIAETIMELRMQESVYQASLASGARTMQPTLLDFLR